MVSKIIRKCRSRDIKILKAKNSKLGLVRLQQAINLTLKDSGNGADVVKSLVLIEQRIGNLTISGGWAGQLFCLDIVDRDIFRRSKAMLGRISILAMRNKNRDRFEIFLYRGKVKIDKLTIMDEIDIASLIKMIEIIAPGQLKQITMGL